MSPLAQHRLLNQLALRPFRPPRLRPQIVPSLQTYQPVHLTMAVLTHQALSKLHLLGAAVAVVAQMLMEAAPSLHLAAAALIQEVEETQELEVEAAVATTILIRDQAEEAEAIPAGMGLAPTPALLPE